MIEDNAMVLHHGSKVRYLGHDHPFDCRDGILRGGIFTVAADYPAPPMKGWRDRPEVSIYVPDPGDNFGGVAVLPAKDFELLEGGGK